LARSFEIRSGQDESPSRFYASFDPSIIFLTRDINPPYYSLFQMLLCEIKHNNYCSLSITTQTQKQQQTNGRGERIENSDVLFYYNINTITIKTMEGY
jgi:hypothetical protein